MLHLGYEGGNPENVADWQSHYVHTELAKHYRNNRNKKSVAWI